MFINIVRIIVQRLTKIIVWGALVQIMVGEKIFWQNVDSLGEASTHNPGMSLCNVYNYRALTD